LLRQAERLDDPLLRTQAHHALGISLVDAGRLHEARQHLLQGWSLYQRQHHAAHTALSVYDPAMACAGFAAHALWLLGEVTPAVQWMQASLQLSRDLEHPYTLAGALSLAAMLAQYRGAAAEVQTHTAELLTLCAAQGFPYFHAWGTILHGWALSVQGQRRTGITRLREGLRAYTDTGAAILETYWSALLAEALAQDGQTAEALEILNKTLARLHSAGEHRWEAELHRQRALLLLTPPWRRPAEAAASLHQALAVAHRQGAKSLELRAAISLSRLWQQQGRQTAARDLLADMYGQFSEGFDTADLREARALLAALA
jgi:predicted ATPase